MRAAQKKDAGAGAMASLETNLTCPSNYIHDDAQPQYGDDIDAAIQGQKEARAFILALQNGVSPPEEFAGRIAAMVGEAARFRGFCRAIQKYLERGSL